MKNLLYHVCPLGNYVWNLEQILKRIDIFDGEKIFAVAQGDGLPDVWSVQKYLPTDKKIKLIPVANDPQLRETASLQTLLTQVMGGEYVLDTTFYAHSKGITHTNPVQRAMAPNPKNEAILLWTEAMYRSNLDNMKQVDELLKYFPVVGAFKRYGTFKHFPSTSSWHYTGTFFWFRNSSLATRPWPAVPQMRYGAEAYPSLMFKSEEAGCVLGDGVSNMYDLKYVKEVLAREK